LKSKQTAERTSARNRRPNAKHITVEHRSENFKKIGIGNMSKRKVMVDIDLEISLANLIPILQGYAKQYPAAYIDIDTGHDYCDTHVVYEREETPDEAAESLAGKLARDEQRKRYELNQLAMLKEKYK
jgi:hypothetical protein